MRSTDPTEVLARYTGGYKRIQEAGYEALTTESHVRYLGAVHFDDRLTIHARCGALRHHRLESVAHGHFKAHTNLAAEFAPLPTHGAEEVDEL